MSATASMGTMKALSIADIERAMREIDLLPKNKDWLLMDPAGNCWKTDDIAQLMRILASHHPLFQAPFATKGGAAIDGAIADQKASTP